MKFLHSAAAPVFAALLLLAAVICSAHKQSQMVDLSGGLVIEDAYIRANSPSAPAAAGYMVIRNVGGADVLIAADADFARRTELHSVKVDEDGVASMTPIEGGIEIPAGGEAVLARGATHVMLMGLTEALAQGDAKPVRLLFENAGEMVVEFIVDHTR